MHYYNTIILLNHVHLWKQQPNRVSSCPLPLLSKSRVEISLCGLLTPLLMPLLILRMSVSLVVAVLMEPSIELLGQSFAMLVITFLKLDLGFVVPPENQGLLHKVLIPSSLEQLKSGQREQYSVCRISCHILRSVWIPLQRSCKGCIKFCQGIS